MFVIPNMSPACEADKAVEVISFDQFSRGKPSSTARYHWQLPDIQQAVFIRLLEGSRKGTVSMTSKNSLIKRRAR